MNKPANQSTVNFLFLGGAKRVAMARMLRKACAEHGFDCHITGYELTRRSALAVEGDIVEGLKWSSEEIYADLDRICIERDINIVLPFVDGAVGVAAEFAAHRSSTGVFSPVSDYTLVETMFDKCAAADLFESLGLPIPRTYRGEGFTSKLIAKPRRGSASKGILSIDDAEQIKDIDTDAYLIQERFDHREEITVDCYAGVHSGRIFAVSPRQRIEVSGGEAVRTVTIDDNEVTALAHRVLEATGLRGAVTIQFLRDLDNGRLMVMEINPRLGGGAVASVHAGVNLPGLIIDDALHRQLTPQTPLPGVETVRYLEDVVFYPENV